MDVTVRSDGGLAMAELLEDGWVASYLFVLQNGAPVLAELNVRPSQKASPARFSTNASTVPPGGLTRRNLQRMAPGRLATRFLAGWEEDVRNDVRAAYERGDDPIKVTTIAGGWESFVWRWMHSRREVPRSRLNRLLMVAAMYASGVEKNLPRINERIAAELGRTASQVRDDVHAARGAGLLTEGAGRGRPSGRLTDKARTMIEELRER